MEIWHNLVAFKKIRHWCPLQKKNQLAMGYMIHVKFIMFSCIPLSCFRGFHHCRVFWPPRRSNVCLVTKGRQPKRLEFTITKYISSEIDINFQKNNVSFSWSAVLPKINKHYDTVVVFESFFFYLMGIKSRGVYALAGWRHPLPWCPPPMWLILTNSTFTSKYYDNVNGATDIRIMSAFWSTELCTQAPWVFW